MNETTVTRTQYNELATSTCTPTGGGASVCSYQYSQKISTTTSTTTGTAPVEFISTGVSTSTANYQIVMMVQSFLLIGVVFAFLVAYIVKKLI